MDVLHGVRRAIFRRHHYPPRPLGSSQSSLALVPRIPLCILYSYTPTRPRTQRATTFLEIHRTESSYLLAHASLSLLPLFLSLSLWFLQRLFRTLITTYVKRAPRYLRVTFISLVATTSRQNTQCRIKNKIPREDDTDAFYISRALRQFRSRQGEKKELLYAINERRSN